MSPPPKPSDFKAVSVSPLLFPKEGDVVLPPASKSDSTTNPRSEGRATGARPRPQPSEPQTKADGGRRFRRKSPARKGPRCLLPYCTWWAPMLHRCFCSSKTGWKLTPPCTSFGDTCMAPTQQRARGAQSSCIDIVCHTLWAIDYGTHASAHREVVCMCACTLIHVNAHGRICASCNTHYTFASLPAYANMIHSSHFHLLDIRCKPIPVLCTTASWGSAACRKPPKMSHG